MDKTPYTGVLKTPSPPAKIKLWLENLDDFIGRSTGEKLSIDNNLNSATNNSSSIDKKISPGRVNHQTQLNKQPTISNHVNQINNNNPYSSQMKNLSNNNHQIGTYSIVHPNVPNDKARESIKTPLESNDCNSLIKPPKSTESQNSLSLTHRSRLGNTGDALTGLVKKYRELQAKSKISLVLDESSTDEDELTNHSAGLSDTPSFKCSTDESEQEEEEGSSSQCTNNLESNNDKPKNLNLRQYKSEPQLSSFEDSTGSSLNGGMYSDSLRYHSQNALKKSAKEFETITVCNVDYYILNVIGEGGSGKVYQVCDCQSKEFYALKIVDMKQMAESLKTSLKKEIEILKMLKGCKRVIQLYAFEMNKEKDKLMLVMEKGDSDLNTVLSKMIQNDSKRKGLDLHTIKHYWNEMLKAVDEMHKKGIVHSDLKPVNFVIVKGYLKIIDFGIADAINPDHTSVIKNNLIGTINFMSPESLISRPQQNISNSKKVIKVNCKSDIWSLGCILYNMCYGRTPFGHIEQIYEKINAICNQKFVINYPPYENKDAVDCIKKCLDRNIDTRPSVAELFQHPFLNNEKGPRLPIPRTQTSVPRNPLLEKRIFDDIGSEVNKLTPRSLLKFKNVMRKELTKFKK